MSIHSTNSGRWEARWREGSRNRGRTFDRKKDARAFEAKVRQQVQSGDTVPTRTGSPMLDAYFARYMGTRHDLAPRTRSLYETLFEVHVFDQIGFVPLTQLTAERLENWQAERLASGAGVEAIDKTVKLLHHVFGRAVKQGLIPRNPVAALERPRKEYKRPSPPATPKQIEFIREWFNFRGRVGDAVLVSLMAYGGLRVGEAFGLKWEDFSHGDRVWICRSLEDDGSLKTTKTGRDRLVVLPQAAAQDLLMWRRETSANGLIFPRAKDGQGWKKTDRANWKNRYFKPAAQEAGWPYPPKNLRMSCASLMIAAGRPPTEVSDYLGHSLAVSVDRYQRLMREMEGQPVRSVDEMIAKARTWSEHEVGDKRPSEANAETENAEELA